MSERMTEEKVAALEAAWRQLEQSLELAFDPGSPRIRGRPVFGPAPAEVADAQRAYLEARAQFEQQRREEADTATAKLVSANQDMAAASRDAARASADAARWAKWAAIGTAIAAVAALAAIILQALARPGRP